MNGDGYIPISLIASFHRVQVSLCDKREFSLKCQNLIAGAWVITLDTLIGLGYYKVHTCQQYIPSSCNLAYILVNQLLHTVLSNTFDCLEASVRGSFYLHLVMRIFSIYILLSIALY